MKQTPEYRNLYFWGPEKVISLLISDQKIVETPTSFGEYQVTKEILILSDKGYFRAIILSDSVIPRFFSILHAKTNEPVQEHSLVEIFKDNISELSDLSIYEAESKRIVSKIWTDTLDTIAEVQQSESWDDPKPASFSFFIGRDSLRSELLDFFELVREKKTQTRVFYLDGNSGWGKSSFINGLKGRVRNKHYKNKYYIAAFDSRSANTSQFVALCVHKAILLAHNDGFISNSIDDLKIISPHEVVTSPLISSVDSELKEKNRVLVIVFDQFEDIFRKGDLFKSFHKLLLDTSSNSPNIVIGFSWKSETTVPISHPSYHLWMQAKEYAKQFNIKEFEGSEIKGMIKQLERSINQKLDDEGSRRISDNSQGFPWLAKKLCIHIAKQFNQGMSVASIIEQDFNVKNLFEEDLGGLSQDEVKALRYIARRAFNNDFFDIVELDEVLDSKVIQSLVDKRLTIKSGTKYNIYWDIFRDYLLTNEVPTIGETFIIRQDVDPVLSMFLVFKKGKKYSLKSIKEYFSNVTDGTLLNQLRELRQLGLISRNNDQFFLRKKEMEPSEEYFKSYMYNKLHDNTFYLYLSSLNDREIDLDDVAEVISDRLKSENFSQKTLTTYSKRLINWIKYSGLDIPNLRESLRHEIQSNLSFTPQFPPNQDLEYLNSLNDKSIVELDYRTSKFIYDLKGLGLIQKSGIMSRI